jgi:hypothetical protein
MKRKEEFKVEMRERGIGDENQRRNTMKSKGEAQMVR